MNDTAQEWQDFFFTSQDGLRLGGRKYGWNNLDNTPVVCLAGLSRSSSDFHELALYLAKHHKEPRRILCLDYRGRGVSEYDKDWGNYNPLMEAQDVLAGIMAAGLEKVGVIGTSRGGLIAMIIAAMQPGVLKSVILNDVGPEIDARGLVRIRQYLEKANVPTSWSEAITYVKTFGKKHFPDWDDAQWEAFARQTFAEEDSKPVQNYDPNLVKTLAAIDLDSPLPTMWDQFLGFKNLPVMAIRGQNSDILSKDVFDRMKEEIPNMEQIEMPNQGHVPHLGGADLPATISAFMRRVDQA